MRLSDIKGDRVFDVIADIIEPIANIAEDKEATALFKKEKLPEGETPNSFFLKRMKRSVPILLKEHKDEVATILATIEGVDKAEYMANLNLVKLTKDAIELVTDEAFGVLFISAQSEDSSGSVSENTADAQA